MVIGKSMLRNVGAEHADMMVESFLGIKTEQLHRVIEKKDLGSPETVIIHVRTIDLRTRNLDTVMGEVYALVATAKNKFPRKDKYCNKIKNATTRNESALVCTVQAIPSSLSSRWLTTTGLFVNMFSLLLRRED